jgi:hypothetical protein
MGLLDWLTDLGSTMGSQSADAGSMPPNSGGAGQPQFLPPVQQPQSPPVDPMIAQTPVQSSPPVMQPPQAAAPQPIPPEAPAPQAAVPPGPPMAMNDTPTQTFTPNAGPPTSLSPPPQSLPQTPDATNPGQARGFLGRAFGMNSSDETALKNKLGPGLAAVGQNWNKPGLAAMAGTAGSAIEGGTKGEEKRVDQMLKLITQKQKAGDDSSATSLARVKLETAQMHLQALKDSNGKTGAWNKPPQQLYQDAMRLAQNDPTIKASQKALEQTIKDGNPAAVQKAQADHAALVSAVQDKHLTSMGLNPQSAAGIAKVPGLSSENPVPQAAFNGKPFDQVVKPNQPFDQYFVDEKGQTRVLRATKKSEASKSALNSQASIPSNPADAADDEE